MNRFSKLASWLSLASLVISVSSAARAQTIAPTPPPQRIDAPQGQPATVEKSETAAVTPQESSSRERRAQAYVKLLEGQRILANLRREDAETGVRQAQQAFQDAAKLDPTLAEAHTALAELLFFQPRNIDQSAREASLAIGIDKDNFGAHRLLSRIYLIKSGLFSNNQDKTYFERAIKELGEVARLNPNDAEAWALLGEFYDATNRPTEAINAFSRWAAAPAATDTRFFQALTQGRELGPDAAAARLGEALLKAGKATEAIAAIRRAIALSPDNREYVELLGRAFEAGGDDASAIKELQRMVAADQTNTSVVIQLARIQARAGHVDDAAATLRAAMARRTRDDRDQLPLRLSLAEIYSEASRFDDAVKAYEELLKQRGIADTPLNAPDDKRYASIILTRVLGLQKVAGQNDNALATIERMRHLFGADDPTADLQFIQLLRDQGKRQDALKAARAARLRFPDESDFVRLEAETLTDLGQVNSAITLLRGRLKGSPEDFNEYLTISSIYAQAGRGTEAVAAARQALALAPEDRDDMQMAALITLSSAQDRAGDVKGSEESLRQVLAKEPNNPTALNNLGYFLVERNERLNEALEMIQRAVRSDPTNSSFLDSLGWAYFKLGQLSEAEHYLREAIRRDNTSPTLQDHLGDILQKQGKADLARAAWQKALTLSVEPAETARIKAKLSGRTRK